MPADRTSVFFYVILFLSFFVLPWIWFLWILPVLSTSSSHFSFLLLFSCLFFFPYGMILCLNEFFGETSTLFFHGLVLGDYVFLVLDVCLVLGAIIIEDAQTCHIRRGDLLCLGLLVLAGHGMEYLLGEMSWTEIIRLWGMDSWMASAPFLLLYLISGGRWLGFSDVCLMWVIGIWLGWKDAICVMWTGCVVSLLFGRVHLKGRSLEGWTGQIPLGPGIAGMAALWGWRKEGVVLWKCLCSIMVGGA